MDEVKLFEGIKLEFEELEYTDKSGLDKLIRRLKMLITKIYDSGSSYLEDLNKINFFSSIAYPNMPDSINFNAWSSGRDRTVNLIGTIIEELELFPKDTSMNNIEVARIDRTNIFIVHGRDDGAKETVARFIDKLGFVATVLHEQTNSGATIIEKIEKNTDVGFGIVLYTACDVGGIKTDLDNLKPRARQNVVFEHGFLMGKIGRENVVALVKGNVEIPNDISGVVYESMDEGGAWKYKIAREMKSSGYGVDMNKID